MRGMPGMEPRALPISGKCSIRDLHLQTICFVLNRFPSPNPDPAIPVTPTPISNQIAMLKTLTRANALMGKSQRLRKKT